MERKGCCYENTQGLSSEQCWPRGCVHVSFVRRNVLKGEYNSSIFSQGKLQVTIILLLFKIIWIYIKIEKVLHSVTCKYYSCF